MANVQSLEQRERDAALRRRAPADATVGTESGPAPHPLLALQRQVGNSQIARMLAQREGAPEEEEVQAKHDPVLAQREGAPEEEEEIQAKHDPALAQREGAPEEEEPIQAKPEVGMEGGPISDELSGRIQAQRGGGAALDDGTRTKMETNFGTSFEDVRVHTDGESDALNRNISAKAFTTGNDVFFRKDTSPGDHDLLAHELTHVVQQRSMSGGGAMSVGPAGDSYEQQADSMAATVNSGGGEAATAQREAEDEQAQRSIAREEVPEEEQE